MNMNAPRGTRSDVDRFERELLARLGLTSQVNTQDIEAAHEALIEFLAGAPHELKQWAQREVAAVDEAYALLSDPTADLAAYVAAQSAAAAAGAPAGANAPAAVAMATVVAADEAAYFEDLDDVASTASEAHPEAQRRAPAAAWASGGQLAAAPLDPRSAQRRKRLVTAVAVLVTGMAALGVVGAVYGMGAKSVPGINGSPAPEASAAAQVDPAQVAALMQKITANPQDVASLQALADMYYQVGDYKTASTFLEKIVAIEPKNLIALLALGAADFNQGDSVAAEKQWRAVLAIDANNVEAHYDLGFMYLSKTPPDVANVKLEWGKVIAINPNSDVAKTVATHLASLEGSPAPSGAAPASAAPSASPAPAASPAPSASSGN
jgi:tetratricopeptide (TPR) repeat protein